MAKKILQDIVFPSDLSKQKVSDGGIERALQRRQPSPKSSRAAAHFMRPHSKGWSRHILWGAAVLAIVIVLFVVFSLFEKATIKVTPKQQTMAINGPFTAYRGTALSGGLVFEIMTLSGEEKKTLPATQVERVDKEASGRIIIYNNFDSNNQQLVARTRFEAPTGLIYRIRNPVVIPGQRILNGEKVPGSVEVMVYADEPGEKYNMDLTDFTIPGFKGSARFDGFYARSATPMTGGFSGIVKTVSNEQLEKATQELGTSLRAKLLQKAHSQKPDDFILYNDAVFFTLEEGGARGVQTNVDKNDVDVIVSGTLHGLIFNTKTLSQFLANTLIQNIKATETVSVLNVDALTFAVSHKELFSPTEDTTLSFVLQGNPRFVWAFDMEQFRRDTVQKSKDAFKAVLADYPSIQKAEVVFRPFWKNSFPDSPDRIKVELLIEE